METQKKYNKSQFGWISNQVEKFLGRELTHEENALLFLVAGNEKTALITSFSMYESYLKDAYESKKAVVIKELKEQLRKLEHSASASQEVSE